MVGISIHGRHHRRVIPTGEASYLLDRPPAWPGRKRAEHALTIVVATCYPT